VKVVRLEVDQTLKMESEDSEDLIGRSLKLKRKEVRNLFVLHFRIKPLLKVSHEGPQALNAESRKQE
jgi:hypothetical protein